MAKSEPKYTETFVLSLPDCPPGVQRSVKRRIANFDLSDPNMRKSLEKLQVGGGLYSVAVSSGYRIILGIGDQIAHFLYVAKHDEAYAWASRHSFDRRNSKKDDRFQVRRHDTASNLDAKHSDSSSGEKAQPRQKKKLKPFAKIKPADLMQLGVPQSLLPALIQAGADEVDGLIEDLPDAVLNALLEFLNGMPISQVIEEAAANVGKAGRIESEFAPASTLEQAIDLPWIVFPHPSQRLVAEAQAAGPLRIRGLAGTGKTIAALHRVKWLAERSKTARILLTTGNAELCSRLGKMLDQLLGKKSKLRSRIVVQDLVTLARSVQKELDGSTRSIPRHATIQRQLAKLLEDYGLEEFSLSFAIAEWCTVVAPQGVKSEADYLAASRQGRRVPLTKAQRKRLWPVFGQLHRKLTKGKQEHEDAFLLRLADAAKSKRVQRFDHTIVDECQNLRFSEQRFLRAITLDGPNDLTLAGDAGQQTHSAALPLSKAGIDVRGRSVTLNVNYRSTAPIAELCDGFRSKFISQDFDEQSESVTELQRVDVNKEGVKPTFFRAQNTRSELAAIRRKIAEWRESGVAAHEIGVLLPDEALAKEVRDKLVRDGVEAKIIQTTLNTTGASVIVSAFARCVGLEFKSVVVAHCSAKHLPNQSVAKSLDADQRKEFEDQARALLYTATSRACSELMICCTGAPSKLLPKRFTAQAPATPSKKTKKKTAVRRGKKR